MKRGALFTLLLLLVCAGIELYLLTVLNDNIAKIYNYLF